MIKFPIESSVLPSLLLQPHIPWFLFPFHLFPSLLPHHSIHTLTCSSKLSLLHLQPPPVPLIFLSSLPPCLWATCQSACTVRALKYSLGFISGSIYPLLSLCLSLSIALYIYIQTTSVSSFHSPFISPFHPFVCLFSSYTLFSSVIIPHCCLPNQKKATQSWSFPSTATTPSLLLIISSVTVPMVIA